MLIREYKALRKQSKSVAEELKTIKAASQNMALWWFYKLRGKHKRRMKLKSELENLGCHLYYLEREFREYEEATGKEISRR